MGKIVALLLLFCAGCFDTHKVPHQDWAVSLVWGTAYGMRDSEPPPVIQWREQETLDCAFDLGRFVGFRIGNYYGAPDPSLCVAGVTWGELWMAQVAHPTDGPDWKFSDSAFAHELWHAALWHWGLGDPRGDPHHDDAGFYPGGAVENANAILRQVHL